jgi:hypothetical protein
MKIYQLVSYVNAYNKRTKQWESLHSSMKVYVGAAGLKTAYAHFEQEKNRYHQLTTVGNWNKYSETRGKVELHIPHVHENGTLAYWGDKVIAAHNPDNI